MTPMYVTWWLNCYPPVSPNVLCWKIPTLMDDVHIFNAPFMGDFSLPRLMTPEGKPGFRCINEIIQHLGDAKRHPLLLTNSSKSNNMYFLLLMYTYNYKLYIYIYIFIFLLAYPVTFSFRSVSYTYFCSNIWIRHHYTWRWCSFTIYHISFPSCISFIVIYIMISYDDHMQ